MLASRYADTIEEIEREGILTKHKASGALSLESGCEILRNTQKLAHIDIVENYKRACDSRKRVKALVRQTVSSMD